MNSKSISFFIVGLAVGFLVATGVFSLMMRGHSGQKVKVLKLAHGLDQSHPVHIAMVEMAKLVKEKSGGLMEMRVFPSGQLGNETECVEQIQRGALAMTKISTAVMESFVPELSVYGIPYAFRDAGHFWRVLEGPIGKELLNKKSSTGVESGIKGLCYYDSGSRNFYTIEKPVLKPDDLKGMKIRVMKSKTAMETIKSLGGSPTPIPWGELYTALQQRMVDGAENNPPSFYTNRHFEVCKYFSFDGHTRIPDILVMSQKVWDSLDEQEQMWVQEAADESKELQKKLWKEMTQKSIEECKKQGVTFYDEEVDKKAFADKVQGMHRSYDGTPVGDYLKRIKETE